MNEKLLRLMGHRADFYPHQLEKNFPKILQDIEAHWGQPDFDNFINSLTLSERNERQGFPPDVAVELFHLGALHAAQLRMVQGYAKNAWDDLPDDYHRGTSVFGDDW